MLIPHPQFEQAAVEVLQKHYTDTEEAAPSELATEGVQVLMYSSAPLTQSNTRSIRDLGVSSHFPSILVRVAYIGTGA